MIKRQLLQRAISWVFAAAQLPPPPLDEPAQCILVRDFEMQNPDLRNDWEEDCDTCAQCAQHICSIFFEMMTRERLAVPIFPGRIVPVPVNVASLADGASIDKEWYLKYSYLKVALLKAVHLYQSQPQTQNQLLRSVFRKMELPANGSISWKDGQVLGFVQKALATYGLPAPDVPDAIWYQLSRDVGADIQGNLTEVQAVELVRRLLETILLFTERKNSVTASELQTDPGPREMSSFMQALIGRSHRSSPAQGAEEPEAAPCSANPIAEEEEELTLVDESGLRSFLTDQSQGLPAEGTEETELQPACRAVAAEEEQKMLVEERVSPTLQSASEAKLVSWIADALNASEGSYEPNSVAAPAPEAIQSPGSAQQGAPGRRQGRGSRVLAASSGPQALPAADAGELPSSSTSIPAPVSPTSPQNKEEESIATHARGLFISAPSVRPPLASMHAVKGSRVVSVEARNPAKESELMRALSRRRKMMEATEGGCGASEDQTPPEEATPPPIMANSSKMRSEEESREDPPMSPRIATETPSPCRRRHISEAQAEDEGPTSAPLSPLTALELELDDVPELFDLVQATCVKLAERLKAREAFSSASGNSRSAAELAARAARALLGEVEAAIGQTPAQSRGRPSVAGSIKEEDWLRPNQARAQWFDVSTPVAPAGTLSSASSPTGVRQPRPSRYSWIAEEPGAERGNRTVRAESPTHRLSQPSSDRNLLEEWVDDVRSLDPCPLLRPPMNLAPPSPGTYEGETH